MILSSLLLILSVSAPAVPGIDVCSAPRVVEMGLIKGKEIDGQAVYLEQLYDDKDRLCGHVETVKQYNKNNTVTKFAHVTYFDSFEEISSRESYGYFRINDHESIFVTAINKEQQESWTLAISTLPHLSKEEVFLDNSEPVLGYLKRFVYSTAIESDNLKRHILRR